jgi:hypothetical protein
MVHGHLPVQRAVDPMSSLLAGGMEALNNQWTSGALGEAAQGAGGIVQSAASHLMGRGAPGSHPMHGAPAARGGKPAAPPVDIHGVADQVYQLLLKRLNSEKQRKGL